MARSELTLLIFLTGFSLCCSQNVTKLTDIFGSIFGDVYDQLAGNNKNAQSQTTERNIQSLPPPETNCLCVPYHKCKDTIPPPNNSKRLIDLRSRDGLICPHYLDVCCLRPNVIPQHRNILSLPTSVAPADRECGIRNSNGLGFRVTGGQPNEAQFGEFPWVVMILKREQTVKGFAVNYLCSGALIHKNIVVTAAHCVNGKAPSSVVVRAGEWDTRTDNELFPYQDRQVQQIQIHENFTETLFNNIALIFLKRPFVFGENVNNLCLPELKEAVNYDKCYSTGWGDYPYAKSHQSRNILKRVDLYSVTSTSCQEKFRATDFGPKFKLHPSFMCVAAHKNTSNSSICEAARGSALFCEEKYFTNPGTKRYVLIGINSWGLSCDDKSPGVYADVFYVRRWISQTVLDFMVNFK